MFVSYVYVFEEKEVRRKINIFILFFNDGGYSYYFMVESIFVFKCFVQLFCSVLKRSDISLFPFYFIFIRFIYFILFFF